MFGIGDVRVVESPTPEPGPGEVLLRVKACLICASDLHMYEEGHSSGVYPSGPIILGHEFSGEVVALGEGVTAWQLGDAVACEPSWHCGHCDMCRQGYTNLCRNIIFPSYPDRDGAMAEYIAVPAFSLARLPAGVDFVAGALAEPLGVALHAVRLSGLQPGAKVAILGAGAIGLAILQVAKRFGAGELLVADPCGPRQAAPAKLGAIVRASAAELLELCPEGQEADLVFEAAGGERSFAEALDLARPEGKVMVVGIPTPDRQQYSAKVPRRKELTVVFCRRSRETLDECLRMLAAGELTAAAFPVRKYSLDEAPQALADASRRDTEVVRAAVCP
jgi:L-iditol 2-dehydrogenase